MIWYRRQKDRTLYREEIALNEQTFTIIRYIVTLLFGVISTAAFANLLKTKGNIIRLFFLAIVLLAIQGILFYSMGFEVTLYLYPLHTHIVLILALKVIFHCKMLHAVLSTLLAYMCCQIPSWISKLTLNLEHSSYTIELLVYIIVVLLTTNFIIRYAADTIHEMMQSSILIAISFCIVPLTYYFFDYYTTVWTKLLYTGNYHVTQFMPFIICIFYLVYGVVYSHEQHRIKEINEEKTILSNQLLIVKSEMDKLFELEQLTKIHRHDMRHHLSLILHMLNQNQTEDAITYIEDNVKKIESFTPKKFCDMKMLNLLLTHFATIAEDYHTDYHFNIQYPGKIPISNTELCALVSNALENALNCLQKLPEESRLLKVKLCEFNGKFIFSVDNSCDKNDNIMDIPLSPKDGHGYGTLSIRSIAQEHNGIADFKIENGIFTLMVVIPY